MQTRSSPTVRGFSLIELLVVVGIISLLLTLGAAGLRGLGGKGTSTALATTEAVFDEARAIAVGKGTKARVLVDVNDTRNLDNYKRRLIVVYQELDADGKPTQNWTMSNRAIMLPESVFFSEVYSKKNHERGDSSPDEFSLSINKSNFDGRYLYYEFNAEGICSTPGASFVVGSGTRTQGEQPRVTGDGKRDFGGFIIWRSGRSSLFRGPDEIGIPAQPTTF